MVQFLRNPFSACIRCFLACDGTQKTVLATTLLLPPKKKGFEGWEARRTGAEGRSGAKGAKDGGPEGWGPAGWWGTRRVEGPTFRAFSLCPPQISFFLLSLGVVVLWPRFEAVADPKFAFELLRGHFVRAPAAYLFWRPSLFVIVGTMFCVVFRIYHFLRCVLRHFRFVVMFFAFSTFFEIVWFEMHKSMKQHDHDVNKTNKLKK